MKLGVVMSGNSARSKAYGLLEVEIASRRGAENLEGCNGAEWYVAASTRRLPCRSTSRECERRKSAPNIEGGTRRRRQSASHTGFLRPISWYAGFL